MNDRMLPRVWRVRLRESSLGESRNFAKSERGQMGNGLGEPFSSPMACLLISLLGRADYFWSVIFSAGGVDR